MRSKTLGIVLSLAVLALPASVSASDDILIVPLAHMVTQGEPPGQPPPFEILDQDLLANDGAGATIVSHTPTSRGDLVRLGPELKFTYTPDTEFWNARMDSFSYVFDALSGARATVFLVADPRFELRMAIDSDLEITSSPLALTIRDGTLGLGGLPPETIPEIRLKADDPTVDSLVTEPAGIRGDVSDSGSGAIEIELDPAGFNGTTDLARVSVQGDTFALRTDIELGLSQDAGAHLLTARCRQDGALIDAFTAVLHQGLQQVALTWWAASADHAFDGGLILEIGNRVVANFSGLDNRDSSDASLAETRLGAMDPAGLAGILKMGRLQYWQITERHPALMPIFADGVESQDVSAWSAVVGDVEVTAAAAILGSRGISIPGTFPAYLVDGSPAADSHYRARFNFDPSGLIMADGNVLTLLAGFDSAGAVQPFAVELRKTDNGKFELCAMAKPAAGPAIDVGCLHAEETAYSATVLWWAAPDTEPEGGMRIWLTSPDLANSEPPSVGRADLDNRGQVIAEARFGVIDPDAGTTGEVHLDDFESWR